jgi:hypothetical protein
LLLDENRVVPDSATHRFSNSLILQTSRGAVLALSAYATELGVPLLLAAPLTGTDGVCGPANGVPSLAGPTSGLCNAGTPTTFYANGVPWVWACVGLSGGTTASCQAPGINGACGSANGVAVSAAPTANLCDAGAASAVTGSGPWNWTCAPAAAGGSTASCSAPKTGGTTSLCGSANNTTTNAPPPANMLCAAGAMASAVTDQSGAGSGPWDWTCTKGATTASCFAFAPGSPQPGPGCIPPGHGWNLVIDDEFTSDTALNTSIWNNYAGWPGTISSVGAGVYEDNSKAVSFSPQGLVINGWDASGRADNPNNLPGGGGIGSKQLLGPGYYEARIKPGANWVGFWLAGNGGSCADPLINGTGGTEDDVYEGRGSWQHNNIHWGGYAACHQWEEQNFSPPVDVDTFHTVSMYWSTTTGKIFCLDGVQTYAAPNATGSVPASLIFDVESDDNPADPYVIQYFHYFTDGGLAR